MEVSKGEENGDIYNSINNKFEKDISKTIQGIGPHILKPSLSALNCPQTKWLTDD